MIKFPPACQDRKNELTPPSVSPREKVILKTDLLETRLIAVPNYVEFRNYKSNKTYRKVVVLQNVSVSLARFQLTARPNYSCFTVMIESKAQTGIIPPGMHVKLIVLFRCNTLEEPEEMLVIRVQHGHSIVIRLHGHRDPPILKVTSIPCYRCPQKKSKEIRDIESIMEAPFRQLDSFEESMEISVSSVTSSEDIPHCKKLKIFDCGECFVGEQIASSLLVQNVGGEGRFFIMSEIDWCSMNIEDITSDNVLLLPCFAMWPAYFTLKPQEHIYLYIYFFPDSHGMHVETLYTICDNCSMITTEMVGDGRAVVE
ncbi:hypothetical protein HN011_010593 [Eciton burchellii]|nr:hypothetical protein HN011_010593 [Eciton burchellii]